MVALEYVVAQREKLPHLGLVLNRYRENKEPELLNFVHERFGGTLGVEMLIPSSRRISEIGPLREIFTGEELRLSDEVRRLRSAAPPGRGALMIFHNEGPFHPPSR